MNNNTTNRDKDSILFISLLFKYLKDDDFRRRSCPPQQLQGIDLMSRCSLTELLRSEGSNDETLDDSDEVDIMTNLNNIDEGGKYSLFSLTHPQRRSLTIANTSAGTKANMKAIAEQVVRECMIKNKQGDVEYMPLMDAVIENLRRINGIQKYWTRTERSFEQYRAYTMPNVVRRENTNDVDMKSASLANVVPI